MFNIMFYSEVSQSSEPDWYGTWNGKYFIELQLEVPYHNLLFCDIIRAQNIRVLST